MGLKEQRIKKGYTAKELGAITGINHRTIQNMELPRGNSIDSYNLDGLCSLALALDCSLFDLLTDERLKAKLKLVIKKEISRK